MTQAIPELSKRWDIEVFCPSEPSYRSCPVPVRPYAEADAGIMATHDLRMCEYVDRVLQMRDGKLVQIYTSREEIMRLVKGGRN